MEENKAGEYRVAEQTKRAVIDWCNALDPDPKYRYDIDFDPDNPGLNTVSLSYSLATDQYICSYRIVKKFKSPLKANRYILEFTEGDLHKYRIEYNDDVRATAMNKTSRILFDLMNPISSVTLIINSLEQTQSIDISYSQTGQLFTIEIQTHQFYEEARDASTVFKALIGEFVSEKNTIEKSIDWSNVKDKPEVENK